MRKAMGSQNLVFEIYICHDIFYCPHSELAIWRNLAMTSIRADSPSKMIQWLLFDDEFLSRGLDNISCRIVFNRSLLFNHQSGFINGCLPYFLRVNCFQHSNNFSHRATRNFSKYISIKMNHTSLPISVRKKIWDWFKESRTFVRCN